MTKTILLFFHTIKYLKIKQIIFQIYYRLFKPAKKKSGISVVRQPNRITIFPAYRLVSTFDAENFTFLGITGDLAKGWNSVSMPKLWLYNLHYQDDLSALGSSYRRDLNKKLISSWIAYNPPFSGVGWDPYCISLRVVNWIKYFTRIHIKEVDPLWIESLCYQVDVLTKRLEFHIMANHLFANAKALVFAGVYFGGDRGARWLSQGIKILDAELKEQFLADGGHYELSPMYHAILMWDISDLIKLAQSSNMPQLRARSSLLINVFQKGIRWLDLMSHPDGKISFFNDSTFGISPSIADLKRYSSYLRIHLPEACSRKFDSVLLADTGFFCVTWYDKSKLIADIGDVGAKYQPGHAHADTLSCELSIRGHRVFVNSGISKYGDDVERLRQRSTSAHNTVLVNGENSSEVWGGFRVARRARPLDISFSKTDESAELVASHNGYHRLKDKVTHQRKWSATEGYLRIEDNLTGKVCRARGCWHIHPDIHITMESISTLVLRLPCGHKVYVTLSGGNVSLEDSTWHPGFGLSVQNKRVVVDLQAPQFITVVRWN